MTSINKMILGAVLIAASMLPGAARAATDDLRVDVPFAFTVSGRELPAGSYVVQTSGNNDVLLVRGSAGTVMVASSPGGFTGAASKPGLVFERHGSAMYLVGVESGEMPSRSVPLHPLEHTTLNTLR